MSNLGASENPLLVAIIGSGPSGFYAAEALIKSDIEVNVDIIERLPSPYGLVRSGVAPDHPKLKTAINLYKKIADDPHFNLIANVTVGEDISIEELSETHHAICSSLVCEDLSFPKKSITSASARCSER